MCFRKFLNAGRFYGADVVVAGGDLTGKLMVPVVETADGWVMSRRGNEVFYPTEEALHAAEKELRDRGSYPFRTTPEELERLRQQPDDQERLRDRLVMEQLGRWRGWADERLGATDLLLIPGNDDPWVVDDYLRDWGERNIDRRSVHTRGVTVVGVGVSNETPFRSARELREEAIADLIDAAVDGAEGALVFDIHVPPRATKLDICPRVDDDLRPVLRNGQYELIHAGSQSVRDAIERYQPILSLHGHIHESPGFEMMGRTVAVNPGSEYGAGVLRGVLATIEDGQLRSHQLISG